MASPIEGTLEKIYKILTVIAIAGFVLNIPDPAVNKVAAMVDFLLLLSSLRMLTSVMVTATNNNVARRIRLIGLAVTFTFYIGYAFFMLDRFKFDYNYGPNMFMSITSLFPFFILTPALVYVCKYEQ